MYEAPHYAVLSFLFLSPSQTPVTPSRSVLSECDGTLCIALNKPVCQFVSHQLTIKADSRKNS